ncbi:hypothetical protein CR513_52293, partial [Mucuna pruriens]
MNVEPACLMTMEKNLFFLKLRRGDILINGCNNHICGDKTILTTLDESYRNDVKFGNNAKVVTNLLSICQLQEKRYEITIKDDVCRIHDVKLGLIAQVKMTTNRLFPLYLNIVPHTCLSTQLKGDAWLCHFRYGHLNFGGLKTLRQKEMVVGLPNIPIPTEVCEECVIGKQHRESFPKENTQRARRLLEIKLDVQFKFCTQTVGENIPHVNLPNFATHTTLESQLTIAYTPQYNGMCERKNNIILNMVRSLLAMSCLLKSFQLKAINWSFHILNRSSTLAIQNMTPEEG